MKLFLLILAFALNIIYIVLISKRYAHMLQLNSYMNSRYLRWFKKNLNKELSYKSIVLLINIISLILGQYFVFSIIWVSVILFSILTHKKQPEKKKFVITSRVKRLFLTSILIGICLMASAILIFIGDNILYISIIYLLTIALSEIGILLFTVSNFLNVPMEKLISFYYYNDAQKILKNSNVKTIIGITGSYGKTSTKFILSKILSTKYNVLMTPESYNTQLGVIRTIREHLKPIHNTFVVEMGAKKKNDIQDICKLVKPNYGILTSIGYQHLETFKNIETIIKTKYELVDAVNNNNGVAFLNFDNTFINDKKSEGKYFSYGIKGNNLNYWVDDINYDSKGSSFTIHNYKNNTIKIRTRLLGIHNVLNILAACSVAIELGVDEDDILCSAKQLPPIPHRLELKTSNAGIVTIDDAYNSNPEGANEALNVLSKFDTPLKILITPGMIELGEKEYYYNYEFGKKAAEVCDYIILVGAKRTKPILEGIKSLSFPKEKLFVAGKLSEAIEQMKKIAVKDCVVLFENDLPDDYTE